MTRLATRPVDDPDQLSLIADDWTPIRKPFADAFRDACQVESLIAGRFDGDDAVGPIGWINPSRVREQVLDHDGYECRQFSALWSKACARDGYMDKTTRLVPITGKGSRGNTNKSTFWRRWRTP
jgi:hypothetical protein